MSIHIVCIVTSNSSWNIVNKLSGGSAESQCLNYENEHGNVVSGISLAKTLNNFYISITADLASLDIPSLPAFLPPRYDLPCIRPWEVCKKLSGHWTWWCTQCVWKTFALESAAPVADICNITFLSGIFPALWKHSYITPIPKAAPISGDADLRPISLTSCVSNLQEDFAVKWLIEEVKNIIDRQQFGSLKGSSTTYCLLDMLENWLSSLDKPATYVRISRL